jgi:hypothetical protein
LEFNFLAKSDFVIAFTCFDDIVHALVVNDNIDFGFLQELNGEF